jgi:hypothetical protein
MNKKNKIITLLMMVLASASIILIASCSKELDNRKYPQSRISGAFLYNGQPVTIMGTASDAGGSNMLQLTQNDPSRFIAGNIRMFAKGDGTFTILTYDGDYTLNVTPGKGPWQQPPAASFTLKGEAKVDFNVTPYYWMSDYKSTFVDSVFTATFKLEKIVPTANLERVVIYFGTTSITDITSKQAERVIPGIVPGNVTVQFNLKNLTTAEKVTLRNTGTTYASVGIKTQGVSDLLYSKVMALK